MRTIIAILLILAGPALASPALFTGSTTMNATEWNSGFSRAEALVPLDATILSARRKGQIVVLYFAFDPDEEYVWRRVVMTRGVHPVVVPLDRFILERGGVYFWDEGQFIEPIISATK